MFGFNTSGVYATLVPLVLKHDKQSKISYVHDEDSNMSIK